MQKPESPESDYRASRRILSRIANMMMHAIERKIPIELMKNMQALEKEIRTKQDELRMEQHRVVNMILH